MKTKEKHTKDKTVNEDLNIQDCGDQVTADEYQFLMGVS
jgi:hypothetical protein